MNRDLAIHCRETMQAGSKSFSLAALLFDREHREAARYLYSWCRFCDDAVDSAASNSQAEIQLSELIRLTRMALDSGPVEHAAFEAFRELCKTYQIPELYPLELLEGMRMDVEGRTYHSLAALDLYCYRVASVVGLMMVHIMGVSSAKALQHAAHTGLAMQMTNIARDIKDDFQMGRIYLPDRWFEDAGSTKPKISDQFNSAAFTPLAARLVAEAEGLYQSGREGLVYLPFRAALAVAAAQDIYREIGRQVIRRGPHAWDSRTVVPLHRKIILLVGAVVRVCGLSLRRRVHGKWRRIHLDVTYAPSDLAQDRIKDTPQSGTS